MPGVPKRRRKPHGSHAGTRPKQHSLLTGVLRVNDRGAGSVETPEGTFFVPGSRIYEAMSGDTVQVRRIRSYGPGDRDAAAVVGVLDRAVTTFAARYVEDGELKVLVPLDDRLCHDFVAVTPREGTPDVRPRDGEIVSARVARYPSRRAAGQAVVERVIGDEEGESIAIDVIVAAHDLAVEFSPAALDQARRQRFDLATALAEPGRRDIRDRFMVTVDPDDARDFDDAVSVEALEGGGWLLGVHIADVGAYVEEGGAIDLDARRRSTSVYLADRVLPMLPEELSCDLCSLRPGEDRLAMTVDLRLDGLGRVVSSQAYPSIVRSNARLRYREVDEMLAAADEGPTPRGPWVGEVDLGAFVRELDAVARLREGLRRQRGAIEFVSVEARAVLDERGRAVDVDVRRPTRATKLVEEAMLAANEAVARKVEAAGVPGAYRVHEAPDVDRLAALAMHLKELGCMEGPVAGFVSADPHAIQAVIDASSKTPAGEIVSALVLRAMKRAAYSPGNDGHFGLGAAAYCHFTSPIRRYPDLVMHRALRSVVAPSGRRPRVSPEEMGAICSYASKMERIAAEAALESQAVKIAEYMEGHVGEAFSGVVCGVQPFGLFVRLDETCAEGLLHVRDLGQGWWDFDESRCELADRDSGRVYRLGQRVAVRVRSCDPFRGRIDFALAQGSRA